MLAGSGTRTMIAPGGLHASRLGGIGKCIAASRSGASRLPVSSLVAGVLALPCLAGLTGCMDSGITALNPVPPYSRPLSRPVNVIERALAECKARSEAAEAGCLKKGLADAGVAVAGLIAMVPNCRSGQLCRYSFTTRDKLGFLQTYAAELTIHWQVTFDLRHAGQMAADVPITVTEVNV